MTMRISTVIKKCKLLWRFISNRDFLISFVATMLGVLVAFWLNDFWHQNYQDKITKHRLHLVVLESQYNGSIAHEVLKVYSNINSMCFSIKRVDSTAARIAFEDGNLFKLLPFHKVSLIKSYIESMDTLNQSLDTYSDYLFSVHFKRDSQNDEFVSTVRNNCAAAIAISIVLRRSLNSYFNSDEYQHDKLLKMEKQIKEVSQKALRGEVKPSKIP